MFENNIAIYIRLSKADTEKKHIEESNSITAQRLYINDYLDKQIDLKDYSRVEYADDGYSGTNGNRPELQRMIEDVKNGHIKTICVKDMSRFFRDYAIVGNYLECVFPFLGVRFISINDNYDSDNDKNKGCDFEMVIRNIVYASYSKDLSAKIKKANKHLINQGKYIGNIPPYGYIMHPTEKYKIIIDPIASKVVKKIFAYAVDEFDTGAIAKKLNDEGIMSQGNHFATIYPNNKYYNQENNWLWKTSSVRKIIQNEYYIGTMVCLKSGKENIYAKSKAKEPIKIKNNHEPIVCIEEFSKAQKVIKKSYQGNPLNKLERKKRIIKYPLLGLVFCGQCKERLYMLENVFQCKNSVKNNCTELKGRRLKISNDILEEKVTDILKEHMNKIKIEQQIEIDKINEKNQKIIKDSSKINKLEKELNFIMIDKVKLYEEYAEDMLSKCLYLEKRKEFDEKITKTRNIINELKRESYLIKNTGDGKERFKLANKYGEFEELNIELVKGFIEKIYIYDNEEVEVILKNN